jgi:hypothetical protein
MGTFADTAIISYCSSFADQGKQTSVFSFRSQQTNGSLQFTFSVCSKQMDPLVFRLPLAEFQNMETWRWRHGNMETYKWRHGDMETWRNGDMETWRHGDMDIKTSRQGHGDNGKQKTEALPPRKFS